MPTTFNFNMGSVNPQTMAEFQKIMDVCKQYSNCEECSVFLQNGLHTNNSVLFCHKVEEKMMKERMNNGK